jgi:HEAT repeats
MISPEDEQRRAAGPQSTPSALLVEALHADDEEERLRAARLLRATRAEAAIPALLTALRDPNAGVRWLAGEALIHIGSASVLPLLETLVAGDADAWVFGEAEHILRHLQLPEFGGALAPVIEACGHSTRAVEVPPKAEVALLAIRGDAGLRVHVH